MCQNVSERYFLRKNMIFRWDFKIRANSVMTQIQTKAVVQNVIITVCFVCPKNQ